MNENLNLVEILKDCPKGTKLYSTIYGEVEFIGISTGEYPVKYLKDDDSLGSATAQGLLLSCFDGECTLFPSKDQRDWSKFTAPWADERPANVWYNTNEKPRLNQWFLAQIGDDAFDTFVMAMEKDKDWKHWSNGINIKRWAYIKDLLLKEGKNENN